MWQVRLKNELAVGEPLFATMKPIEKEFASEKLSTLMQSKVQDRFKKIARKSNNFINHCFVHLYLLRTFFCTHDSLKNSNGDDFMNGEHNEHDLQNSTSIKDDEKHQHRHNLKILHRLKMMRNINIGIICKILHRLKMMRNINIDVIYKIPHRLKMMINIKIDNIFKAHTNLKMMRRINVRLT